VALSRINIIPTRKNNLYSPSQIYHSYPHHAFSLFPVLLLLSSFGGWLPYPTGVGAQEAKLCVLVFGIDGCWLCLPTSMPEYFVPACHFHQSLKARFWSFQTTVV